MEWISVKDKFPDTTSECIIFGKQKFDGDIIPETYMCTCYYDDHAKKWKDFGGEDIDEDFEVTHWTEIPEPPTT